MAKEKVWTKEEVLADWLKPLKKGLGRKRLAKSVFENFENPLLEHIQKKLDNKKNDYNKDRKNARAVARTMGRFCKELSGGSVVQFGVFKAVFIACKLHHRCPGGAGSGKWCDI